MLPSINGDKEVIPSCVKLHLNKFAQDDKIIIKNKVSRETVLCIASDNSLRSTRIKYHKIIQKIPNLVQMDPKNWLVWCNIHLERIFTFILFIGVCYPEPMTQHCSSILGKSVHTTKKIRC